MTPEDPTRAPDDSGRGQGAPSAQLRERGREVRKQSPRRNLGELTRSSRSALDILGEQNATRIPGLVPLRYARMLTDPFAFYRGGAAIMAADLAASASSGIEVAACGDAHISNFGLYASPARDLVFDVNDFDEAAYAPWEWDVKRLVTSAVVGARHAGHHADRVEEIARDGAWAYLRALTSLLESDALARFYRQNHPGDIAHTLRRKDARELEKAIKSASKRTSARVFKKITERGPDGMLRLREDPPILQHLQRDRGGAETEPKGEVEDWFHAYLRTTSPAIALLLSQFRLVDGARRVVGVGSVGTTCYLAILLGPSNEPLILQLKQAEPSVLTTYGGLTPPPILRTVVSHRGQGARVVALQRILQATSDPFIGSVQAGGVDLYVRQFQDMKGSLNIRAMGPRTLGRYVQACAAQLARAHAQSPRAFEILGYAGGGGPVVGAITRWSLAYADVTAHDFQEVTAAGNAGAIEVAPDPLR